MERVAALLDTWAQRMDLPERERVRWAAAGWLHDALKDADPARLRDEVPPRFRDVPDSLLHGPAVAERLTGEADASFLDAVRYHTIGHPRLDRLGRALYLADFLEPGRDFEPQWRGLLRDRVPEAMEEVLPEVVAARIRHLIEERRPLRPETASFWSSLVHEHG